MNGETTLSVSEFIAIANQTFEFTFPSIYVEGEVSSFKVNQGKYVFFDLKDTTSSINCFMMLFQMRFPLEDGMKIVVRATPKVTNWGKFSITVHEVRPVGEGNIRKSFELLKNKLSSEGLFAVKRSLPHDITRIAVISSIDAAGYKDFIKILNERWAGLAVDVAHVQVQGSIAPDQIIRALKYFNERAKHDVIVIARGGGSADDLSAFNDELLVRAIAASKLVTVTGIGHESDETLADLAADICASTPSNAAQMLTRDKTAELENLHRLIAVARRTIVDHTRYRRSTLHQSVKDIAWTLRAQIQITKDRLDGTIALLDQLNPENVLKNGYAYLRGAQRIGDIVTITTYKNIIQAEVKDVEKRSHKR